uniref:Uncharacterized protein n=1 Tax=viral metagenome TaxID=1070528 RepID=A0A6M3LBA4_9ZZZZ
MGVRPRGLLNTFEEYKKKGMSDTEAMEKAMATSSAATLKASKARIAEQKKKKGSWVSRLKRNVAMVIKGPGYYKSTGGKHPIKKGK